MEDFKIIKELSSCRFCTTSLVTKVGDFRNRKLVLKKIECKDENHANKAYTEQVHYEGIPPPSPPPQLPLHYHTGVNSEYFIMQLLQQKLHQDNMEEKVATKSFFIMWDKSICSQKDVQEASVFICVIRNYFETSLAFVADSFHLIKTPLGEQTIVDYLSQIVHELEPYHIENIAHRSLQLSNIFKCGVENKMHLVDFGITSFMADREKVSAFKDEDLVWLAPELRFPPEKDKAEICWLKVDIWCLGSIMMSFLLTSFIDTLKNLKPMLMNTKAEECLLNNFWEQLQKMYSEDLLLLAKRMMSKLPENRPTLIELKTDLSKMYHSDKPNLEEWPEDYKPISEESPLPELLDHMVNYSEYSKCVSENLTKLNECLLISDVYFPVDDISLVWEVMRKHLENPQVLTEGLQVIQKLISQSEEHLQIAFSQSNINIIIEITATQHKDPIFKNIIYNFLLILLTSETATDDFNAKGGMTALLNRLPEDLTDVSSVQIAAMTLSNLVVNPLNAEIVLQRGLVKNVYESLQFHCKYQEAVAELVAVFIPLASIESALIQFNEHKLITSIVDIMRANLANDAIVVNCCITLQQILNNISIYDDGMTELIETSAAKVMLKVLTQNTDAEDVIIECCTTLATLCVMNRDSTYVFLSERLKDEGKTIYGLQLLLNIYNIHKDVPDAVAAIFKLLLALSKYDVACKEVISYEYEPILKYCITHFHYNQNIVFSAKNILKKLNEFHDILM